jgi:hypothetical protein
LCVGLRGEQDGRALSKNYRELSRLKHFFTRPARVMRCNVRVGRLLALAYGLLLPDPPIERLNELCEVGYGDYRA